jgi:WD40 repeat protein
MKRRFFILFVFSAVSATAQQPVFTVHRGNMVNLTMMDISPDNKYAVTVDKNDEAIIWDIKMGVEIKRLKEIKAAAFTNADQMVIAVSNRTGLMKRYAQNNFLGNPTPDFPLPNDAEHYTYGENARSYQPLDGVVICENKLFNINTGTYTVMGYEDKTRWGSHAKVVYSPALKAVVAGEKGGVLNIYEAATGQLKQSIDYKTDEYKSDQAAWAGVSENGKLVGLVGNGKLYITDLTTKQNIFTLKSQWGTNGYITNAAFIDNDKLLVINEDYISLYSLATKEMLWQYEHKLAWGTASFIKVSKDKSKIFASSAYQKNILVLNTKTGTMVQHMKSSFSKVNLVMQPQYDNNIISLVGDGRALQLNLRSGMLENKNIFKLDEAYWKTKIICKENDIYCDNSYLNIFRKNARNEYKSVFEYKYPAGSSYFTDDYYVSPDNKLIVIEAKSNYINETACKKEILFVIDKTGKKQWELPACDHLFGIGIGNKKNIMALGDTLTTIFIKEIETGKTIKKITSAHATANKLFSPSDRYLLLATPFNLYTLFDLEKETATPMPSLTIDGYTPLITAFSPDEKKIAIGTKAGSVWFYDITSGEMSQNNTFQNSTSPVTDLKYSEDGDFMFVSTEENLIKVWDLKNLKNVAVIYTNTEGNEFLVKDGAGRFDGNSATISNNIYYVKGLSIIPISNVFETFYTPNLLARILNREVFDPVPVDVLNIHPSPTLNIVFKDGKQRNLEVADDDNETYQSETGVAEITVTATAPEDKVEEIRLFHNGKIINLTTRNLLVTDDASGSDTKKYTVNLLPGKNRFRAIALNSQRTESSPKEITVNYANKSAQPVVVKPVKNETGIVDPIDKTATLHLVVVGINKYQNEKMSLNYALADATAFKVEVEKDAKSILSNIKTYFITDNNADKNAITTALKEVQQNAKPQDVFVFYYAGHGVIAGKNKEFYLVPTNVTDLKNVDAALDENGVPAKLLQGYAVEIQAQKQLFILDACQSAGAFEAMLSADANQQKSLAVVARSTGTHWMAASGAQQFANEFSSLGHGAFTYVLLQALKGEAANNKMITVNGLKNFLQVQVPALMKKYNGSAQYPASYGFGNDFPVEVIR